MSVDQALIRSLQSTIGDQLTDALRDAEERGLRLSPDDERALTRKMIATELEALAERAYRESRQPLTDQQEVDISREVMDRLHGLGRIQPLLEDPTISNVFINGCDSVFITYTDGSQTRAEPVADTDEELIALIVKAARRLGRSEKQWDDTSVSLNLQLPGGDRLHAIRGVTGRPTISIRRHNWELNTLDHLQDLGLTDRSLSEFIGAVVRAKLNVVVAGGTNTGKTTLLRAMINEISPEERLITIEDSLELGIERFTAAHPNLVTYEARPPNIEGVGEVTMAACLREALRQSPDRVIVGETRGVEVVEMLQAMSQGNDGSMCSIHANSASGALVRLAQYAALAGLDQQTANLWIANSVDLILHIGWINKIRRVTSVIEVREAEGLLVNYNTVFKPSADGRAVPNPGHMQSATMDRLVAAGFDRRLMERPEGWWAA